MEISPNKMIKRVYTASFFLAAGTALAAYVNSSFLNAFFDERSLGIIFSLGAMFSLFFLTEMPPTLRYFGNRKLMLSVVTINLVALFGMTFLQTPILIATAFIAYMVTNYIMVFCFDVFVTHYSERKKTGKIRGLYLSIYNSAWVLAPLITTTILTMIGFKGVYGLVGVMIAIVFLIVYSRLYPFHDSAYKNLPVKKAVVFISDYRPILNVTLVNFLLQFFYSWMVIYSPIYLRNHIGLEWKEIGIIFTTMLTAFVLFQYPLGRFADKKSSEKEIMTLGLIIGGLATILIGFLTTKNVAIWALVFFFTRVGASTVEAMSDIHFFKETEDADASIISVYRMMAPFSYLIAPIIGSLILFFLPFNYLFIILGVLLIIGIKWSMHLELKNKLWKKSHTQLE